MSDPCMALLIARSLSEMRHAPNAQIRAAKLASLHILIAYGWRDVFRESLIGDRFKSREEAGRFGFCAAWVQE